MFWKKPPETPKTAPARLSREELIRQAKAHAAAAREELGSETIDKMRAILLAQEKQKTVPVNEEASPSQRARELIETMDKAKVADYLRTLKREDN